MKNDLVEKMKVVLADTFTMYLKAQHYHWNVEGPNFSEYHDFFGALYEELHGAVDAVAENIRKLGAYAPGSMERLMQLKTVDEDINIPPAHVMMSRLLETNERVMATIKEAYRSAEENDEIGLSNYLQDRYDVHCKHKWMINAYLKG